MPTIVRCSACGTGATVPPPDRDVYGDGLFSDEDAGYGGARLEQQAQWLHEADLRVGWLSSSLRPGAQVLEIGSATGEFVARAEQAGFAATGLETSPRAAADARRITTQVQRLDLTGWRNQNPDIRVDAVVMFHVLEHFNDPVAFLTEIRQILTPGGQVFVEVPNGGSRRARALGVAWWAARPEDHYFHFTRKGLEAAFARAGMKSVRVKPVSHDIYIGLSPRQRMEKALKEMAKSALGRPAYARDLLRATAASP